MNINRYIRKDPETSSLQRDKIKQFKKLSWPVSLGLFSGVVTL